MDDVPAPSASPFAPSRATREDDLRREYDRLAAVIRGARLSTWSWNVPRGSAELDDALLDELGYGRGELAGTGFEIWHRLVHPDDHAAAAAALGACLRDDEPDFECEFRMRHRKGYWRWFLSRGRVMSRDEAGRPLEIFGTHIDITERKRAEDDLRRTTALLDSVRIAQSLYIREEHTQEVFDTLVDTLVRLTDSEFGFLDEVRFDDDGTPYKVSLSLSNIAWNAESQALYEQLRARSLEFRNLGNLSGRPVVDQAAIITNDAMHDPRAGGLPEGHPRIRAFMGLPIRSGDRIVGVAGVANRPGGYDEEQAQFLAPYLNACASIIDSFKQRERQRAAMAELGKSERLLAAAERIAHVGSWQMELPSGRLTWSDETIRICGVDAARFDPNYGTFMDLVHPDDRNTVRQAYESAMAEHRDWYEVEHRLVQPLTGDVRDVLERCTFEHDASGAIVRAIGMVQDITERKRTDTVLRRFKAMFDTANFGAAMLEPDGHILYINDRFAADHGYVVDELVGQPFVMLHPPDRLDVARGLVTQMRTTGAFGPVEVWRLHKDGSTFPALMTGCAIRGERGEIESFAATALDIRQQKALEAQLAQARKMESVGRLAGGVAHDFNNMLGVILGYTGLALGRVSPQDPLREYLEEINAAARRSAGVAQQLLAFARRQAIAPKLLDLNEVIENGLGLLRRLIGENIVLAWRPAPSPRHVLMDPSQVHQVLTNLCVNARDAITGVGRITLETENVQLDAAFCDARPGFAEGDYVLLTVSDTGCGMDRETLDNLFEPFFTTKDVGKGTGLGLATVYGIVSQNRGCIDVESGVGTGTVFRIYLPAHDVPTAARVVPDTDVEPARAKPGETILIVEDEPSILRLTTMLLKMLGYTVLSAVSPGDAIERSETYNGRIDVLLTDVVMPEMTGRDLVDRLTHERPGLKHVFMSGYTANAIEEHGVLEPGVHFIQKPFTTRDLAAKLREALDG